MYWDLNTNICVEYIPKYTGKTTDHVLNTPQCYIAGPPGLRVCYIFEQPRVLYNILIKIPDGDSDSSESSARVRWGSLTPRVRLRSLGAPAGTTVTHCRCSRGRPRSTPTQSMEARQLDQPEARVWSQPWQWLSLAWWLSVCHCLDSLTWSHSESAGSDSVRVMTDHPDESERPGLCGPTSANRTPIIPSYSFNT